MSNPKTFANQGRVTQSFNSELCQKDSDCMQKQWIQAPEQVDTKCGCFHWRHRRQKIANKVMNTAERRLKPDENNDPNNF